MTSKIRLDTIEDLKKYKKEIESDEQIENFEGKIIDGMFKFYKEVIEEKSKPEIKIDNLKFLIKKKDNNQIFIKGDYYQENVWDRSKEELKQMNDNYLYVIIDITNKRNFEKNSKINFKFLKITNGEEIYEEGSDRCIDLENIKNSLNEMKNKYSNDCFTKFKVKDHKDDFSYDFQGKTLTIECEEINSWDH